MALDKIDIIEVEERGLTSDCEQYLRPKYKLKNFFKYGEEGGFWQMLNFFVKFWICFGVALWWFTAVVNNQDYINLMCNRI